MSQTLSDLNKQLAAKVSHFQEEHAHSLIRKGDFFLYPRGVDDANNERHYILMRSDPRSHFVIAMNGQLCRVPPKAMKTALRIESLSLEQLDAEPGLMKSVELHQYQQLTVHSFDANHYIFDDLSFNSAITSKASAVHFLVAENARDEATPTVIVGVNHDGHNAINALKKHLVETGCNMEGGESELAENVPARMRMR